MPLVEVRAATFDAAPIEPLRDRVERAVKPRRGVRAKRADQGLCIGFTEDPASGRPHVPGSVIAQLASGEGLDGGIRGEHVHFEKVAGRDRRNVMFAIDTSGSMLSDGRLAMVKGCVVSLLKDAYRTRTRVAIVSYGGAKARLALPFSSSPELAARRVEELLGGGGTPLIGALSIISSQIELLDGGPLDIVLLSDGRYDRSRFVPSERRLREFGGYCQSRRVRILLIDAGGKGRTGRKRTKLLAAMLRAEYRQLEDMRADSLTEAVIEFSARG